MLETNIICIQTRLYFKQTHANAWIFSTSRDILVEPFSEINLHCQPTLGTAFNSLYYFLFLKDCHCTRTLNVELEVSGFPKVLRFT